MASSASPYITLQVRRARWIHFWNQSVWDPGSPLPPPIPSPLSPPAHLVWRADLPRNLSTRPCPPFSRVWLLGLLYPPLSPLVFSPMSTDSLSSPSCAVAQISTALDPTSTVSTFSPPPYPPFPAPLTPWMNVLLPIILPRGWHRGSHLRMTTWPCGHLARRKIWATRQQYTSPIPTGLTPWNFQGQPAALPWWWCEDKMTRIGDYGLVKLDSTCLCHTKRTPQECGPTEGRRRWLVVVSSQNLVILVRLLDDPKISELLASLTLQEIKYEFIRLYIRP